MKRHVTIFYYYYYLVTILHMTVVASFIFHSSISGSIIDKKHPQKSRGGMSKLFESSGNDDGFDMAGKIESTKSGVVGLFAGGIALTPFSALHNVLIDKGTHVVNGVAQWEFDTDMGSLEGALFAIVYRYCIRADDNPMLNQGCIGAFVLVRTLSKIQIPSYCSAVPLDCGNPLGYFDWDMISQAGLSGLESAALFGAAALAMDYCFENKLVSKFRC